MELSDIIELNVGGVYYSTSLKTLTTSEPDSLLAELFVPPDTRLSLADSGTGTTVKDMKGRCFIDRDGALFRYVLDFLRTGQVVLPAMFREKYRLAQVIVRQLLQIAYMYFKYTLV